MLERTEDRFGLKPDYLTADSAYGSAENLAWPVKQKKITPHIPVFDKSTRTDGTFSRADFTFGIKTSNSATNTHTRARENEKAACRGDRPNDYLERLRARGFKMKAGIA
jgi:hypothetical protein